jgi:N-acyl homoserine lactone hydrolase
MTQDEAMTNRRRRLALPTALLVAVLATTAGVLSTCTPTTHGTVAAELGVARTTADLESVVDEPGPVTVETVVGADWEVDRSGLVNLKHPAAKAAHLVDGPEPIIIAFHAIRHPRYGLFIVDTGVERALRDDREHAALSGIAARSMGVDKIRVRTDTRSWIDAQKEPVRGVFLDLTRAARSKASSTSSGTAPCGPSTCRATPRAARRISRERPPGRC